MNLFMERFLEFIALFFVGYMILYTTFLFLSVLFGAIRLFEKDRRVRLRNEIKHDYYMPISILMPAYNEGVTIVDNVRRLLQLDYKLYEVIIIDDGSTDETTDLLLEAFPFQQASSPIHRVLPCNKETAIYEATIHNVKLTLIQKERGGKGDALNMGINASLYPYFVTLDADSLLQSNALEKIIQPVFADDQIIAVGGMVQLSQCVEMTDGHVRHYWIPWQPIVGMQVMEYDRSFLASRILFDQFSGNLIISGAFGLYKKDIVLAAGGYKTDTIGEDMELVMRLHSYMLHNKGSYKIRYQPEAICWSQAPRTLRDIVKQRSRWHIGLFQSLISYPEMLRRFRYKPVGFISYLYYWVFELLGPFIEVFGIFTILLSLQFNILNVPFMINLFFIYTGYGIVLSLTAFFQRVFFQGIKLKVIDIMKAILFVVLENTIFRYFLSFVRVTSFIGYKKRRNIWGSITRTTHKNGSRA
ncbi:glycosyltransferase family 2 protein [Bacillus piscicola]|uniref:glycosyltransferase family 2 protein n=1 Tax=Bacillus piscicola TaxID=1632684 RepID=UPI001F09895D|nr:glycosyltransferase [Bacillus piscicola]